MRARCLVQRLLLILFYERLFKISSSLWHRTISSHRWFLRKFSVIFLSKNCTVPFLYKYFDLPFRGRTFISFMMFLRTLFQSYFTHFCGLPCIFVSLRTSTWFHSFKFPFHLQQTLLSALFERIALIFR